MTDTSPIAEPLRPFSEWVTDHAQGAVDDEMTLALADLVQAVAAHGKKGTVTLKVTVEPAGSGGRTVETSCLVEAKAPQPDPEKSIFFVGERGSMERDDPYHKRLPLKRVGEPRLPNTED
jgi:hypothetical protein